MEWFERLLPEDDFFQELRLLLESQDKDTVILTSVEPQRLLNTLKYSGATFTILQSSPLHVRVTNKMKATADIIEHLYSKERRSLCDLQTIQRQYTIRERIRRSREK